MNGKFVIFDNNSKFGTLIKLNKPFPITNDKVAIQVGRTVITFVLKPLNSITSGSSTNGSTTTQLITDPANKLKKYSKWLY